MVATVPTKAKKVKGGGGKTINKLMRNSVVKK